jgi:hypothetical protein
VAVPPDWSSRLAGLSGSSQLPGRPLRLGVRTRSLTAMATPDPFPEPPPDDAGAGTDVDAAGPPMSSDRAVIEAGRRKGGAAGAVLAGAMVAMRDLLEGPPKEEIPIEVEASSQPVDVDKDGVAVQVGDVDVAAPALERKVPLPRAKRRRRS